MSENVVVKVGMRLPHSSNSTNRLRREGFLPGILYGPKDDNLSIKFNKKEFEKIFYKVGEHTILNLVVEDKKQDFRVLIHDYQIDPVDKHLTHVDFLIISDDRPVKTNIPIRIIGAPKGVKVGGILEEFITSIKIKALPKDIPHFIEIDVTDLDVSESYKVRDLTIPENVTVLNPQDQTIVGVVTSRVTKEEEEEAAETEEEGEAVEKPEETTSK